MPYRPLLALLVTAVAAVVAPWATGMPPADAARGDTTYRVITFPVQGRVTYRDDFGECRGGSTCPRQHEGNDLMGAKMLPLVAARDGVIDWLRVDDKVGTAGNGVSIRDADGWRYVYIHLNNDTPGTDDGANPPEHRFAPGIELGARVTAGQLIGWLGDSGNAEETAPHLHFEIRRPEGSTTVAISPYVSLRLAQGLPATPEQCAGATNPPYTPPRVSSPMGYWVLGRDGGIFAFGDAGFFGSTGGMRLNRPVVGMAPTASGRGYWLVASDGGVFAFGDAPFLGSTGDAPPRSPIISMVGAPSGAGYWLLTADGTVLAFGDAEALGSLADVAGAQAKTAVGIAPTASGQGYWVLTADGAVVAFGDATDFGSPNREGLCKPAAAVALRGTASGQGYVVATSDGSVYVYGDARWAGDLPARSIRPNQPVLGIAVFDRRPVG